MELIQHPGVDIDAQDELGLTALWDAASWGYSEIVNMLAKAGADINMPAMDGSTPVHAAASYGYSHTIEVGLTFTFFTLHLFTPLMMEMGLLLLFLLVNFSLNYISWNDTANNASLLEIIFT